MPTAKEWKDYASVQIGVCPTHKRYKVKRKPTCACESCWYIWFRKQGFIYV